MALAEFFTIQKFMTLISRSQHFMKIYVYTYVVSVMQLRTMHNSDLHD